MEDVAGLRHSGKICPPYGRVYTDTCGVGCSIASLYLLFLMHIQQHIHYYLKDESFGSAICLTLPPYKVLRPNTYTYPHALVSLDMAAACTTYDTRNDPMNTCDTLCCCVESICGVTYISVRQQPPVQKQTLLLSRARKRVICVICQGQNPNSN